DATQVKLFEEANAEDLSAAEQRLKALVPEVGTPPANKDKPARKALPAHLPRTEIRHEPSDTTCKCGEAMKRIGEDVSERLDYVPGVFSVQRHIRGVWACKCCECMRQEAMPAQIIDAGIPTANLLAHVLIAKHDDHLPLYRQCEIYARAGVDIALSTLADWVGAAGVALAPIAQALKAQLLQSAVLHADESPVTVLDNKGKKHRGYIWAYATGEHEPRQAVVYQIKNSRAGKHVQEFLRHEPDKPYTDTGQSPPDQSSPRQWSGHLVVDGYSGYSALFEPVGHACMTAVGCWVHLRRNFFELHASSKSTLALQALNSIGELYGIEREIREQRLDIAGTTRVRQERAKPLLQALHAWLIAQRANITDNTPTAKAIDYATKRWASMVRYADDGRLPLDNNRVENQIRPWAVGRKNWLFAGSFAAAARAADIMTLIQSAKMNGIDPMAYLSDVLTRLPTHPNSRIAELLPTQWRPTPSPAAQ
ncbi:MAG: IS66 family transposase, partial [Burkholderiales bacterium]